jgi:predicted ATPase
MLSLLQEQYERICIFSNWSFGRDAATRQEQDTSGRADFLSDGGGNLALVLSKIRPRIKIALLESLAKLYEGIEDVHIVLEAGKAQLYLQESGDRLISAARLSDGTLHYLCLLAILLHPEPPPLIALDEPELGLHPDVIPHVAELLIHASERTQLVVATHSRMLVDALSGDPSSVIVCEKVNGESRFERLEAKALALWLEQYSLGELWSMGELGGNRW